MIAQWTKSGVSGLLLLLIAGYVLTGTTRVIAATPITVQLRPQSHIESDQILLKDVAEIFGGDVATRHRLGEIDLAMLNDAVLEKTLTKSLINVRIQLDGFTKDDFQLIGPPEVLIKRIQGQLTDGQVIHDLEAGLTEYWKLPENAVELQLLEPLDAVLRRARIDRLSNELRVGPLLEPTDVPGRMRLRAGVYREDQLIHTMTLHVSVVVQRPVAVALNNIRAKQTIAPEDITYDQKPLTGRAALQTQIDPVGRLARRYIESGEPIMPTDVNLPPDASPTSNSNAANETVEAPQLVKRKSPVSMVVRMKGLMVTRHNAELTRDARVGDFVEVKHTSSNKPVRGRLVSPVLVEVTP